MATLENAQAVTDQISAQEMPQLETGNAYTIWSPHDAYEAADVLLRMLEIGKPPQVAQP
jgi:hypothetical protein